MTWIPDHSDDVPGLLPASYSSIWSRSTSVNSTPSPWARLLLARKYIRARPLAAICCSFCSLAPCSLAVNSWSAKAGGRDCVMSRIRASSVVPDSAVNPKGTRVETTSPSVDAASFLAFARTCGCHLFLTSLEAIQASHVACERQEEPGPSISS